MRCAFALALIASVVPAREVHAMEHQMRISEVLVSADGDTGIQYVELTDPGESFPTGTYQLHVYDATGTDVGAAVTLNVPASTTRFFVATGAADTKYGTTRDATLSLTLPTDGQVCFQNSTFKIHCVAWGCINTLVATGLPHGRGASPSDGLSLQRNGNGTYFLGTPTPDAANLSGTPGDFCPTDPDAGVANPPPDAAVPDANPDAPDAATTPGDDDDTGDGAGGGGGGCCRVAGGDAGGAMLLALATMLMIRRRATRP